jgi:hypothetical protein
MKKLLITVDYSENTRKWWFDSSIKKLKVTFDPEKQTIHELIKEVCEDQDGMELTYKGKPQGNVYRDLKAGGSEIVGYMYRGKSEIYDRNMPKAVMVFWDVWVTIEEVIKFEFEKLEY